MRRLEMWRRISLRNGERRRHLLRHPRNRGERTPGFRPIDLIVPMSRVGLPSLRILNFQMWILSSPPSAIRIFPTALHPIFTASCELQSSQLWRLGRSFLSANPPLRPNDILLSMAHLPMDRGRRETMELRIRLNWIWM